MTAVLAKELGPRKIRVNSINPGLKTIGNYATLADRRDFSGIQRRSS